MSKKKAKAGIKPEVLAAIAAAVALYGYSAEKGYQVTKVEKRSAWKFAGISEIMIGRDTTMRQFGL